MPVLNWIGKEAVVKHHKDVPFRLLEPVPELSCVSSPHVSKGNAIITQAESQLEDADTALSEANGALTYVRATDTEATDTDASENLIVQGDNLHALKALLPRYAGQVKCIYIDPPYNTGNEGWAYNDNVKSPEILKWLGEVVGREGETLDRHDRWLCMMYPRLLLLKQFLREDGAIFVSIDDNEVGNLRILMDEIFGARNFVVDMIWQKMDSPSSNYGERAFSNYHDHTIIFAKDVSKCVLNPRQKEDILDAFNEVDEEGRVCRLRQMRKNGKGAKREDRPTMWYPIIDPDGNELFPIHPTEGWEGRWTVGKATYQELASAGQLRWKKRPYGWMAYTVEYPSENPTIPNPSILTDAGQNRQGKAQLNDVLGTDHGFDTPKPYGLVQRILQIATDKDSLILDSFAGSGTTGHAVLKQNSVDGGNRKFILVEMDEKIARDVTAERVRRVAAGYSKLNGDKVEGLGGGFGYYRLSAEPLFEAGGPIRKDVTFAQLAEFVWFMESGSGRGSCPSVSSPRVSSPHVSKGNAIIPQAESHLANAATTLSVPNVALTHVRATDTAGADTAYLGTYKNRAVFLLYNGILKDKTDVGGNVLNSRTLEYIDSLLPGFDSERVIYGARSRFDKTKLAKLGITFHQLPYDLATKTWF